MRISWSLDCEYYHGSFDTRDELLHEVMISGMDPNYEITANGFGTGEMACDLIVE